MMNVKQIEYFVEVAKTLNYTKAAENLYISQSAITKQIFLLEEELGIELFIRSHKGVQLTLAGELFLKDAIDILQKIEGSQRRMKDFKEGKEGYLKLGYVMGLERTSFITTIDQFYQHYPHCYIDYDSATSYVLRDRLLKEQVDMILTHHFLDDSLYENIMIFQSQMMVYVRKDSQYSQRDYFEKDELYSLDLVFDNRVYSHDIQTMTIDHLLLQVMGQKEMAILPDFALKHTQFEKYIIGIPIIDMKEVTYAIYRKDNQNPLIHQFISILKDNF